MQCCIRGVLGEDFLGPVDSRSSVLWGRLRLIFLLVYVNRKGKQVSGKAGCQHPAAFSALLA